MRHLDDEDIAGLIDGTVNKKERETFLNHLSQCKDCLTVYSETLKFIEDEKAETVPFGERLKITIRRFGESMDALFPKKILIPAGAAVVFALVIGIFLLINSPGPKNHKARAQFIAAGFRQMDSLYTFSPTNNKTNAAVRAGFLTEDLLILTTFPNNEKLKTGLSSRLKEELKTLVPNEIFPSLQPGNPGNIKPMIDTISRRLKEQSLFDLYSLGRFIERSALGTFENKTPGREEMDEYVRIARENNLPPGFFKRFRNVSTVTGADALRGTWKEIKEIFLVLK